MTRRIGVLVPVVLLLALILPSPLVAHATWPQAPPNDPEFAPCENAATFVTDCYVTGGANHDQFDVFGALSDSQYPCPNGLPHPDGGLPCWAASAFDPNHMAGANFTGAWTNASGPNIGRNDVLVAYIEGGVNYSADNVKDSLDNQWLN